MRMMMIVVDDGDDENVDKDETKKDNDARRHV